MRADPLAVDGQQIMTRAQVLAFPRYPGTPGDARAIEMVDRALREAGLEVELQEFSYDIRRAFGALRALLIGVAVLVFLAGALLARSPAVALLALSVALLAGGVFLVWAPWLERLYRAEGPTRTANVAGWRRVRAPRLTLILLAHHDSKSQSLTLPFRAGLTLLAVLATIGLAVLLVLALLRGEPAGSVWLAPACGAAATAALLVLSTLRSGNRSPGGVDNAGSLAIVLELARSLPAAMPEDVELIFLSPGAEEDHMVGAMRWLDAHLEEFRRRPVYGLNLDGAGIPGRVTLLERYGLGRAFAPRLSRAARRVAAALEIPVRGVLLPPAMGIDAIPFAHRGIECLTLASGSLDRAVLAVHSAGDRAENLDPDALERAARLTAGLALEVARETEEQRADRGG